MRSKVRKSLVKPPFFFSSLNAILEELSLEVSGLDQAAGAGDTGVFDPRAKCGTGCHCSSLSRAGVSRQVRFNGEVLWGEEHELTRPSLADMTRL